MTSRLTTPFGRESTAAEVLKGVDLTGKRAIVTGGASGIGVETARALAGAGAEVTIAVRNQEAGRRTADSIDGTRDRAPSGARAGRWRARRVGQFGGTPAFAGRLRRYPLRAPGLRAVVRLRAVQDGQRAVRRRGDQALGRRRHPGQRAALGWHPDQPAALRHRGRAQPPARQRHAQLEDHRARSCDIGTGGSIALLDGIGGRYFEDCNEAEPNQPGTRTRVGPRRRRGSGGRRFGVAAYALDPEAAARLWQVSIDTLAPR